MCQCGARHCLACLSLVGSNNARQLCEDCAICQNCNRQQLRGLSPCTATYSFEVKRYQRNTEYFTNVNRKKFILQRVEPTQEFVFLCGQCYRKLPVEMLLPLEPPLFGQLSFGQFLRGTICISLDGNFSQLLGGNGGKLHSNDITIYKMSIGYRSTVLLLT